MLTAKAIKEQMARGNIVIRDFKEELLNPNSVDLTLHPKIKTYSEICLDPRKENRTEELEIPEVGMMLHPGELYLARTNEWTETHNLIPLLEGKSSLARLGISIHATAGFGDIGFKGYWTLEISVIKPVFVYPNMKIGQVCYHEAVGDIDKLYDGKYQNSTEVGASKSYQDF
jgi:dCTP deaminase